MVSRAEVRKLLCLWTQPGLWAHLIWRKNNNNCLQDSKVWIKSSTSLLEPDVDHRVLTNSWIPGRTQEPPTAANTSAKDSREKHTRHQKKNKVRLLCFVTMTSTLAPNWALSGCHDSLIRFNMIFPPWCHIVWVTSQRPDETLPFQWRFSLNIKGDVYDLRASESKVFVSRLPAATSVCLNWACPDLVTTIFLNH